MKNKTKILFRWLPNNHYTISALIGLLDDRLDPETFHIGTLEHWGTETLEGRVILAYSFTSTEFPKVSAEIQNLKKKYGKGLTIICGGPHATARPEECLSAGADYVFTGEAEESLPKFLRDYTEFHQENRIIRPLPLKDFDQYPSFAHKRNFFGPIELRRGCLNKCSFCQTPCLFPKIREHSIEYVLKYADYIRKAGRERVFFTISDALLYGSRHAKPDLKKIETLLAGLKKMDMRVHMGNFPSEVSPRTLSKNPEAAEMLARYISNRKIIVGGQSASDRVLGIMKRDHTVKEIEESVRILKSAGFASIVDIMFGIPGEKKADRLLTLDFIRDIGARYNTKFNIHYFMPLPGTKLEDAEPEPIENAVKESVHQLFRDGIAIGDFFEQLNYGSRGL